MYYSHRQVFGFPVTLFILNITLLLAHMSHCEPTKQNKNTNMDFFKVLKYNHFHFSGLSVLWKETKLLRTSMQQAKSDNFDRKIIAKNNEFLRHQKSIKQ